MEPQNIRTSLLQTSQNSNISNQENHQKSQQEQQKKVKKRMTSLKHPPSQYKSVMTKIFCSFHPITQNDTLDTMSQCKMGLLYIGGSGVIDQQTLKKHQIRAVLSVMDFKRYDKQNLGQKIEENYEIQQHQYIDVPEDHPDIGPYLDHSFDFISENLGNGLNMLVHSNEGLSRAPAIVINYLMRKHKMKFDEAYQIVKKRKPQIDIKENLVNQLKELKY